MKFWDLGCLSGMALGLPAMMIGNLLAQKLGAGTALTSVIIGNLLLWIAGFAILSMTGRNEHAIENIKEFFGSKAATVIAVIWVFAFVNWYSLQIDAAAKKIGWEFGLGIGFTIACLSLGGINWIKQICRIGFGGVLICALYLIGTGPEASFEGTWGISVWGIATVIVVWLPGIVNLPTIFRNARSKDDKVLGLGVMTILHERIPKN